MSQESIENLVRGILQEMNSKETSAEVSSHSEVGVATVADYPIAKKHPEWIKTKTGKTLEDITLSNVMNGSLTPDDLKITPAILKAQGEIATSAGRKTISRNFERAAELTVVPDERVLAMYNALRPYRSSKQELLEIADELENKYSANISANYFREAANHYEKRKKLKGDN
ncbi:diol dehydratase small subunit [Vagococcus carniphilus]|uniref:Diol dehydratase small subunit n=1 Tax=Vagococcus carniphilus TaxID=218144 RepID=A0A430AXD9_9ENTE|nr:diol dehydratase small subunit [Vagococcus carniphilus]MDT2815427.1 diol dehydratase small subunit [Vagococcus carniphilus]MDT2830737.1 diol dehydratase small subunit [Vagococcus carniphilus]MDT2833040.1 diol dehydratase small subunit [Vagococcus carniphilus]MDT2839491.1 diol dehydratase small subunit [Vagococcus carniphilus]MDT2848490.1 diol dehydratase small subunit [Vagococcus carniphilus]